MPIPSNLLTPGTYNDVNTSTQRSGLPANIHRVVFITADEPEDPLPAPVKIYDQAEADAVFGADSVMGQMITAAIKTNPVVNVQGFAMLGE